MRTEIEDMFFKAFEQGGVANDCIEWIRQKYDLHVSPQKNECLPNAWERYYNEILPQKIRARTDAFDDTVVNSLIDEIESNLEECPTDAHRQRYLFRLLKPFKGYSDVYHPTAEINRLKARIEECKRAKSMWEEMPENKALFNTAGEHAGIPKDQAEACASAISNYQKGIDRLYYINQRFCEIIGVQKNGDNSVEDCFAAFTIVAGLFSNRLDALLLEHTEFKLEHRSLIWLQRECGIYLKSYRCITDVDYYLGSMELAQKYINEVRCVEFSESQQAADGELSAQDSTGNDTVDFPKSLLTLEHNKLRYLFDELTKDGHFLPTDTNQAHFNYVFGGGMCPKDFAPLHWQVGKNALSELVVQLIDNGTFNVPDPIAKAANNLFVFTPPHQKGNKKVSVGTLSNPKKNDLSKNYGILEEITKPKNTRSQ